MVEVSLVSKFQREDEKLNMIMSLVGHSWAPQILHRLDYHGKLRYNELKGSLKNVSSTSLSRTLTFLTRNKAVRREVVGTSPPQSHYSLTKKGKALARLLADAIEIEKEMEGIDEEESLAAVAR